MTDEDRAEIKEMIEIGKQECMLLLPEVAMHIYVENIAKMQALKDFMANNKDLVNNIEMLRKLAFAEEEVEAGLGYDKRLEEAGKRVREKMKLAKGLNVTEAKKPEDLTYQDVGQL